MVGVGSEGGREGGREDGRGVEGHLPTAFSYDHGFYQNAILNSFTM